MTPLKKTLTLLLASSLALNAAAMLVAPHRWYLSLPTVPLTGPFNQHFVRDIGCAYAVAALGLAWRAWHSSAWPAAVAGAAFLLMHFGVHIADFVAGRCGTSSIPLDSFTVGLPAVLAAWLAWPKSKSASVSN